MFQLFKPNFTFPLQRWLAKVASNGSASIARICKKTFARNFNDFGCFQRGPKYLQGNILWPIDGLPNQKPKINKIKIASHCSDSSISIHEPPEFPALGKTSGSPIQMLGAWEMKEEFQIFTTPSNLFIYLLAALQVYNCNDCRFLKLEFSGIAVKQFIHPQIYLSSANLWGRSLTAFLCLSTTPSHSSVF